MTEEEVLYHKQTHCVECGKGHREVGFMYAKGELSMGPAYWSAEGVLCGHVCALAHFKRLHSEGRWTGKPSPAPGVA